MVVSIGKYRALLNVWRIVAGGIPLPLVFVRQNGFENRGLHQKYDGVNFPSRWFLGSAITSERLLQQMCSLPTLKKHESALDILGKIAPDQCCRGDRNEK